MVIIMVSIRLSETAFLHLAHIGLKCYRYQVIFGAEGGSATDIRLFLEQKKEEEPEK